MAERTTWIALDVHEVRRERAMPYRPRGFEPHRSVRGGACLTRERGRWDAVRVKQCPGTSESRPRVRERRVESNRALVLCDRPPKLRRRRRPSREDRLGAQKGVVGSGITRRYF